MINKMKTEQIFTKYERARILGARSLQIAMNAPLLLKITKEDLEKINFDALKIAEIELSSNRICFTTDSYVVKPLFFGGGDIGKLAVCGTVNDLAVAGAKPIVLSLSLIIVS